jgi:hypothetical protein
MQDFIKEYYSLITYSVEFLAVITGALLYKKYSKSPVKYVIYFLIYAFVVDLIGNYPRYLYNWDLYYMIEGTLIEKNYWWYNIFWCLGTSFFVYYINYEIVKKTSYKKVLRYGFIVYLILFISDVIFNFEKLFVGNNIFLDVSTAWIVFVFTSIYFIEILQSDRIMNFYRSVYFYFNSALLVWFLITTPLIFFEVYFSEADWDFIILKWQIYLSVNVIFYITLTFSLIFCQPQTR